MSEIENDMAEKQNNQAKSLILVRKSDECLKIMKVYELFSDHYFYKFGSL